MLKYDNNMQGQNAAEREEARREFIFSEIVKRQELLGQKRKKINGEIYELSLMENDVATIVREDIAMNYSVNIFAGFNAEEELDRTWLRFNAETFDKFTKEEQEKCTKSAEFVNNIVVGAVFNNNPEFVLTGISRYEDKELYYLAYAYKEITVYLGIPVFTKANGNNYNALLDGYILCFRPDPENNRLQAIAHDLNYTSISPAFFEWYNANFPPKADNAVAESEEKDAAAQKASKKDKKGGSKNAN